MKILGNILGFLLGLALMAVVGFYGYLTAKRFVALFARLDFTVALVTAIATVTVLLAAKAGKSIFAPTRPEPTSSSSVYGRR